MKASELELLSRRLVEAGCLKAPTFLLIKNVPVYEVDFEALEFEQEVKLPAEQQAVLALAKVLHRISPASVDSYLGLGDMLSQIVLDRLTTDGFLKTASASATSWFSFGSNSGQSFFQRVVNYFFPGLFWKLEALSTPSARPAEAQFPAPTLLAPMSNVALNKVHESTAPTQPVFELTVRGREVLAGRVVHRERSDAGSLLFLADPLLYVGSSDESHSRFSRYRRERPLEVEDVPDSLRRLGEILGLPILKRREACGMGERLQNTAGIFKGLKAGSQWEVRRVQVRAKTRKEEDSEMDESQALGAKLILAAVPSSDLTLTWKVFIQWRDQVRECSSVKVSRLLDPSCHTTRGLLASMDVEALGIPLPLKIPVEGVFPIVCGAQDLVHWLGEASQPSDLYAVSQMPGWDVGMRVRARPADIAAGHIAFFTFLRRREEKLREDFDGTCASVKQMLQDEWGLKDLPSVEEAVEDVWQEPALRKAVCNRKLHADLIAPYLGKESGASAEHAPDHKLISALQAVLQAHRVYDTGLADVFHVFTDDVAKIPHIRNGQMAQIAAAKDKVMFCSFLFADTQIVDALCEAAERLQGSVYVLTSLEQHLQVQVESDEADSDAGAAIMEERRVRHNENLRRLATSGVWLRSAPDCHAKFCVTDDEVASVISANATGEAYKRNPENGLVVLRRAVAHELGRLFAFIWLYLTDQQSSPGRFNVHELPQCSPPTWQPLKACGGINPVVTLRDYEHSLMPAAIDVLDRAGDHLGIATYSLVGMEVHPVGAALGRAIERDGVELDLLLQPRKREAQRLTCAWIVGLAPERVRLWGHDKTHMKAIVADGRYALMWTGNLDKGYGWQDGIEVGLHIQEEGVAAALGNCSADVMRRATGLTGE